MKSLVHEKMKIPQASSADGGVIASLLGFQRCSQRLVWHHAGSVRAPVERLQLDLHRVAAPVRRFARPFWHTGNRAHQQRTIVERGFLGAAVATGLGSFFAARLLLGVGEAPTFPASSKAVG